MLRRRVLEFLYDQVNQNKIPQIKKGMVEDLEQFVNNVLEEHQIKETANRMINQQEKERNHEQEDTE